MARWLSKLLAWCIIASCLAFLVGRVGWLTGVWRLVRNGEDLSGYEKPTPKLIGFIKIETGDWAVYLAVITLLVAIVAVAYAPRLSQAERQKIASLSLIAVAFSLIMIVLQIAVQDFARLYVGNFNDFYIWNTTISLAVAGKELKIIDGVPDPHYVLLLIALAIFLFMMLSPDRLKRLFSDLRSLVRRDIDHA
jgi:hypothetical protein